MDFFETIALRRSVRTYRPDPVPMEVVIRCVEAARAAPSWRNGQCWRFVVIDRRESIEQLAAMRVYGYPINSWLKSAPMVVVACAVPSESGAHEGLPYWAVDTAIAMEHLVLAATAQGLGTCWIGGFEETAVRQITGAPADVRVVALTPLGFPAEREGLMGRTVKALARSRSRKPLEKILHIGQWGSGAKV